MYTRLDRAKEKNRKVNENSLAQKNYRGRQVYGYVRSQSKHQPLHELKKIASRERRMGVCLPIQKMGEQEKEVITNWIRMYAPQYLTEVKPDKITDAELSRAVRLRWFDLMLQGVAYKVGVNIHYNGKVVGGVWVTNKSTGETIEFHPHNAPQHGFGEKLISDLKRHVMEGKPDLHTKLEAKSLFSNDTGEGHKLITNDML